MISKIPPTKAASRSRVLEIVSIIRVPYGFEIGPVHSDNDTSLQELFEQLKTKGHGVETTTPHTPHRTGLQRERGKIFPELTWPDCVLYGVPTQGKRRQLAGEYGWI